MSRIARNSVNGRLNRNTFCSGAEVVPVQCKRGRRVTVVRSKHPFWAIRYLVNVYCDRDISCMVIVTYHVLIGVLLVSYVVSIQCRSISVRFTSIVKVSNSSLHWCFCFRPRPMA